MRRVILASSLPVRLIFNRKSGFDNSSRFIAALEYVKFGRLIIWLEEAVQVTKVATEILHKIASLFRMCIAVLTRGYSRELLPRGYVEAPFVHRNRSIADVVAHGTMQENRHL